MRKLVLRQVVEHVALVLALVHALFEHVASALLIALDTRVVAGDDIV